MINATFFSVGILILILLASVKRFLAGREKLKRNSVALDGALFGICFLLLGFHFYEKKEKAGLLAVGMGATAIGKYLYDKSKIREEN